ncbi:MAG: tandem-95 repeat protein, partial [Planctomycetes bacterium]|nr:tandem-95 repeat protein [Planctomycetota bacterium]
FQMFADRVPRTAGRIMELARTGFYDAANNANPVTFHRVIPDFVIQGGDPTGTGSGGSQLGDVDDQYHVDLQHNRSGVLSYAKSTDDTNDSQFFVTAGPSTSANGADVDQRNLDFNHSVVGQLIEGDRVRKTIERTPTDANDKPTNALKILSATVFQDEENGLVMLKAIGSPGQQANVTITITDQDGHSFSRVIPVTLAADTRLVNQGGVLVSEPINSAPFLDDIPAVSTTVNTPVTVALHANDVENDPSFYAAIVAGSTTFTLDVDSTTGVVTVTPPVGYVGVLGMLVGVRGAAAASTVDVWDTQSVSIHVVPAAPTLVDLESNSDSGVRNDDNITKNGAVGIRVDGVTSGATVQLLRGAAVVKEMVAPGDSVTMDVDLGALGDGTHVLRAVQRVNGETSGPSPDLTVVLDRSVPQFTNTVPGSANVGVPFAHDVATNEEAGGVQYSLPTAPNQMTVDPFTGAIAWTPSGNQAGAQSVTIDVTDAAGNSNQQQVTIQVAATQIVQYRIETTRPGGQASTVFEVGEGLVAHVYVRDLRGQPRGPLGAYVDLNFPGSQLASTGPIEWSGLFGGAASGTIGPSLLDEVGGTTDGADRDGAEYLLFSAPFRATAPGNPTLRVDPADTLPAHATTLVGLAHPVDNSEILFGAQPISVFLPFTVRGELVSFTEDTPDSIDVLANDYFTGTVTGPLRVKELGTPSAGGQVSIQADQRIRYVPAPHFNGTETFTYDVTDDVTGTARATVTVLVQPVNDPPTAVNDAFGGATAVQEDSGPVVLDVLANDSAAPDAAETLRIVSVGAGSNGGTIAVGPSGTHVTYRPAPNFHGTETFAYTISDRGDATGITASATVSVEVLDVNDPPVGVNDTFGLPEDSAATRFDPLANDHGGTDPRENLIVQSVTAQSGAQGTIAIVEGGKAITYRPPANFFGQELFAYTLADGRGGTIQAIMRFNVSAVNDPPTAVADTGDAKFRVSKNTTNQAIDVLRNDHSAPDAAESLVIRTVTAPSSGQARVAADGKSVLFTPPADYVGTATFQYTIEDPGGLTSTATAEVDVQNYSPSSLAGKVYVDGNRNGLFDANERPLVGVAVALVGVDVTGAQVQRTTRTGADGAYRFAGLAPGNYELRESQPAFFVDGRDTIGSQGGTVGDDRFTIALTENTQGVNNNFGERGPQPAYVGFRDLFSSSRQSVLVVVDEQTGQTQSVGGGGWQDMTYTGALLSNDRSMWNFSLRDANQTTRTLALPNRFSRHLLTLGRSGTQLLLRILGSPQQVPLGNAEPAAGSSGGSGEGAAEGEASSPSNSPSPANAHATTDRAQPIAQPTSGTVRASAADPLFADAGAWKPTMAIPADLFSSARRRATSRDVVLGTGTW